MKSYKSAAMTVLLCIIAVVICSCDLLSLNDNDTYSVTQKITSLVENDLITLSEGKSDSITDDININESPISESILIENGSGPYAECEVHDESYHSISYKMSPEKFNEWKIMYNDIYNMEEGLKKVQNSECPYPESNIVTYVKYCDITKDRLIEYRNPDKLVDLFPFLIEQNPNYLEEEYEKIDAIYSDDTERINLVFKNKDAVYANGKYYSKGWLYNHTAEDYEKENLPMEQLMEIYKRYEKSFQTDEMKKITTYGDSIGYSLDTNWILQIQ